MAQEGFKRKLTAILSADVEGYSRLMAGDEAATVSAITHYRKLMVDLLQRHHGRVMDAKGDNVLAAFGSVVNAVQCAVEIQAAINLQNANLPEDRQMKFRIGINLGDVIEEGGTIYGDGVNVAARIESLAEAGGVCISKSAFEQVRNKLSLGYAYWEEHKVKNIPEPVRVYRVLTAPEEAGKLIGEKRRALTRKWPGLAVATVAALVGLLMWQFSYEKLPKIEAASIDRMAFPLPDQPSIAVLPFDNMSDDPKQEFLCDGFAEEIITALSKTPKNMRKNMRDIHK